jgi:competence ComEA-like helix-hairpin-helix protein
MKNRIRSFTTLLSTVVLGAVLLPSLPAHAAQETSAGSGVLLALLAESPQLEGKLNINTATAQQWELLPGIGPSMAQKLVAYRASKKFEETTHVMRIKGIGRKTYERIKPFLALDGENTLQVVKNK